MYGKKGAYQLHGNHAADNNVCFRICKDQAAHDTAFMHLIKHFIYVAEQNHYNHFYSL